MLWTPIYNALAQVAALSGIPANAIAWNTQPGSNAFRLGPTMTLAIRTLVSKGIDFEERVDAAPLNQVVTAVGQRQFVWQVRVDSPQSDPTQIGEHYAELLRVRMLRQTTNDILEAAGLALVDTHPTMEIRNVVNERTLSSYVTEYVIAAAENDIDTTAAAGNYIGSVVIASNQLTGPDGNPTTPQVSVTAGP